MIWIEGLIKGKAHLEFWLRGELLVREVERWIALLRYANVKIKSQDRHNISRKTHIWSEVVLAYMTKYQSIHNRNNLQRNSFTNDVFTSNGSIKSRSPSSKHLETGTARSKLHYSQGKDGRSQSYMKYDKCSWGLQKSEWRIATLTCYKSSFAFYSYRHGVKFMPRRRRTSAQREGCGGGEERRLVTLGNLMRL